MSHWLYTDLTPCLIDCTLIWLSISLIVHWSDSVSHWLYTDLTQSRWLYTNLTQCLIDCTLIWLSVSLIVHWSDSVSHWLYIDLTQCLMIWVSHWLYTDLTECLIDCTLIWLRVSLIVHWSDSVSHWLYTDLTQCLIDIHWLERHCCLVSVVAMLYAVFCYIGPDYTECLLYYSLYHQTSNKWHTLVDNEFIDHSNVVFHSRLNTWLQLIGQRQLEDEMRNINVFGFDSRILEAWWYSFWSSGRTLVDNDLHGIWQPSCVK